MSKSNNNTSLHAQYQRIHGQYPDAILLFRVGDFYETFGQDAVRASKILNITLTSRNNGYAADEELAGFPYHAIDSYLPKLIAAGYRVAICDQLEDPKFAKGLVKRGVTEVVTPGTAITDGVLQPGENNFLCSLHLAFGAVGVAFLDNSTGDFFCTQGTPDYIDRLLASFAPREIIYERAKKQQLQQLFRTSCPLTPLDDWVFSPVTCKEKITKQFDVATLKGFGIDELELATTAAGAILHYLSLTEHNATQHINNLQRIDDEQFVWLDRFTIRNLELFTASDKNGTLFSVLNHTSTPMGARLLRRWIAMPLTNKEAIEDRQSVVTDFYKDENLRFALQDYLKQIGDLERLVGKIATNRINPRELLQLRNALAVLPKIKDVCLADTTSEHLHNLTTKIDNCEEIKCRIEHEIEEEPAVIVSRGGVIRRGVNEELDYLRDLSTNNKEFIASLQTRLQNETQIPSLKISYNNVFGYYIEVRNTYRDRVPEAWTRKQTVTTGERYVTDELKEYEQQIQTAEEKILQLETQIFQQLLQFISQSLVLLKRNAELIAQIDVLHNFACIAHEFNYYKPKIADDDRLDIFEGRHPVIERLLPEGETYIANDVSLDKEEQQIIIVTGPNMAGKSALLRQTALIVLMAQIGSYVPAKEARIGIVDKIFTRVGASDNLSQGESTFMVEMTESANILNNVTPRSLVLFDELGRGTSTYDGISLAWSIVEYLHETPRAQAKTLFATHYHELNEMESRHQRIKNFNVAVREANGKIIFLRKLVEGGAEHSFGIHVASMAGLPKSVVQRAEEILHTLENSHAQGEMAPPVQEIEDTKKGYQLSLFTLDDPLLKCVRDEFENLDLNNITPLEALQKLHDIKKILGEK